MGVLSSEAEAVPAAERKRWRYRDPWDEVEVERPPTFPEMLATLYEAQLAAPEPMPVQPKWIAGGAFQFECEFFKFVRSRDLIKQEGLILRHLLRLVILAGEFQVLTADPEYGRMCELATQCCQRVDASYTARFLEEAENMRKSVLSR